MRSGEGDVRATIAEQLPVIIVFCEIVLDLFPIPLPHSGSWAFSMFFMADAI